MKLGEKRTNIRGWARTATLDDGRVFYISVAKGRRVRIAFARRGENIGWEWWAYVGEKGGKRYQPFLVAKSNGVRGILRMAGVIPNKEGATS